MNSPITIHWFRRDLRLNDNTALFHALEQRENVQPIFIFDTNILDDIKDKTDARVQFIHEQLEKLNTELARYGSSLWVFHGTPKEVYKKLAEQFFINSVYTNHDYEPYAQQRDAEIEALLNSYNISFHTFKDQVIFEKSEVVKADGKPYTVFTPYSKAWKNKLQLTNIIINNIEQHKHRFNQSPERYFPTLQDIGFHNSHIIVPEPSISEALITNYHNTRNMPSGNGTSRLSVYLRFGTISIRQLVQLVRNLNETFLNELIWREFYMMILWHFPHVVLSSFKPVYDNIVWRNNQEEFNRWCNGSTGVPIVDAGMRELNQTGFMHNRVRMITSSFLIKDLLIDWRWGEAYFASKLLDFELSSNNGGWQWASSGGCDAAPYFRIFNPVLQTEKFDAQRLYINQWVPEWQSPSYPKPIVDHTFAKDRVLKAYKAALG